MAGDAHQSILLSPLKRDSISTTDQKKIQGPPQKYEDKLQGCHSRVGQLFCAIRTMNQNIVSSQRNGAPRRAAGALPHVVGAPPHALVVLFHTVGPIFGLVCYSFLHIKFFARNWPQVIV